MAKKKRPKRNRRALKESAVKVYETPLTQDSYEEWLGKQTVKPAEITTEVKAPANGYEEWLGKQTVKPIVLKMEVQIPANQYENWLSKQVEKKVATEATASRVDVSIPLAPFYFFADVGRYTGTLATSMPSLIEALRKVEVQSIEFHLYRQDFERWIQDIVQAPKLTEKITDLRREGYKGETLRRKLIEVAEEWPMGET